MQYVDCSNCRARLRVGLLYSELEACPRCGARLTTPRRKLGDRLRRGAIQAPDWEQITRSQYKPAGRDPQGYGANAGEAE